MAEPSDLESRVSALETEVRQLAERVRGSEQDAAAARVLAGGADRDVSVLRGEIRDFREQNTRVLNAMREDLTDLRTDMSDLRADLTDLRSSFDAGFLQIRGRLDATEGGLQEIVGLLNTLIARGDA